MRQRDPIRHNGWYAVILLSGGVWLSPRAQGLTINLSYDSTVTSLPYASSVENATQYAADQLENVLTNNITINIDVQASDNAFGGSGTGLTGIYSYSDIRNLLTANATTAVDAGAVAMMNTLPDPTQGGNFWIPTAEAKALGQISGNDSGNNGTFVFGTNNPWTFDPNNRSVSGDYDFVGVALHEITECMGRTSVLGGDLNGSPGWIPFDLFRFVQPGWESTNNQDNGVYFSVDQGQTNLKNYNPASNGGDLQDWAAGTPDAADQASVQGTENDLSPADIATLDAIGYMPVSAPRTLTWDGSTNLVDSSHWLYSGQTVPAYIGAALVVNSGTLTYTPPDVHSNLILSSSSIYGTGLTITGGSVTTLVNTFVSGLGSGTGAGLYLTTGSSLNISGTGQLNLAGELVIGGDAGSNVTATVSGGSLTVGQSTSNVDPTLYVGLAGTGTLNQSGNSTITTTNLFVASLPGSVGTYHLQGGNSSMIVNGATVLGGNTTAAGGTGTINIGPGELSTQTLTIWSGTLTSNSYLLVKGPTINNGKIQLNSIAGYLKTINGTGSITVSIISDSRAIPGCSLYATSINQNSLTIGNGGNVYLSQGTGTTNTLDSLTIASTGTFDLADNNLDIDYAPNTDPITTIRSYLTSGYFDRAFNCYGITSSAAAANAQHSTALGYTDTGSQIIIKYTWYGDANLDGVVNAADLAGIKSNGTTWATGDFNYDGVVNNDDYALYLLGAADGKSNITTTLPEPAVSMVIAASVLAFSCGRKRRGYLA